MVYDLNNKIYTECEIDFANLSHLETIGLIRFDPLAGFQRTGLPKTFPTSYYGSSVLLNLPKDSDNSVDIGKAILTKAGYELAPISGSEPVDGFLDFVIEKWRSLNYFKDDTKQANASTHSAAPAEG